MTARQDRGNAGTHWTFAYLKFSFATDQRGIADFHTGHVCDGIKLSGCALDWNSKIACPNDFRFSYRRRRFDRLARRGSEREHEHEHETAGALRVHHDQSTINYQPSTFPSRLST